MKKMIVYLLLCILFCWGALCVWNWAPDFAKACHTETWLFDSSAVVLFFVALIFSCLCSEQWDKLKGKKEA